MFENITNSDFDKKCMHIFNLYNKCAKHFGFRKALKLTPQRKKNMTAIVSYERADLALFLRELRRAKVFFKDAEWFDFDWMIKEDNFIKVMEGKYSTSYDFSKQNVITSKADYKERVF